MDDGVKQDIKPIYFLEQISEIDLMTELVEASPLALDQAYSSNISCESTDDQMLREIVSLSAVDNSYCAPISEIGWSYSNYGENIPIASTNNQMNLNSVDNIVESQTAFLPTENHQEPKENSVSILYNSFSPNVTQATTENKRTVSLIPTHVEYLEAEELAASLVTKTNKLITRRCNKRYFNEPSNGVQQKSPRTSDNNNSVLHPGLGKKLDTVAQRELLNPRNLNSLSGLDTDSLDLRLVPLGPQPNFNSYQSSAIVPNAKIQENFTFQHGLASVVGEEVRYQHGHVSVEEGSSTEHSRASVGDDSQYQHNDVTSSVSEVSQGRSDRESRRRAQNRKAAKRFRLKKKTQEEKLNESMESLISEKEVLKADIGNLVLTAQRLSADLNRHLNNCPLPRIPQVS